MLFCGWEVYISSAHLNRLSSQRSSIDHILKISSILLWKILYICCSFPSYPHFKLPSSPSPSPSTPLKKKTTTKQQQQKNLTEWTENRCFWSPIKYYKEKKDKKHHFTSAFSICEMDFTSSSSQTFWEPSWITPMPFLPEYSLNAGGEKSRS